MSFLISKNLDLIFNPQFRYIFISLLYLSSFRKTTEPRNASSNNSSFKLGEPNYESGTPTMTIPQRNRVRKSKQFDFSRRTRAKNGSPPCGEFLVTSVKQSVGWRGIDDPGRRDTSENRGQRALKRKEEGGGGKGAAVGQVKWRVPAGFYAALATGPPCLSATFRSPTFYFYHSRLPAFRVPVSSHRQAFFPRMNCLCRRDISRCFQRRRTY